MRDPTEAPGDAPVLDLSRCYVVPGLIDVHTHLLLEEKPGEDLGVIAALDHAVRGDADRVLSGAARARSYLDAGFTSVRDLGNSGRFLDIALARAVQDGRVAGPSIYGSGPGLAPAGGQMPRLGADPHQLVAGEYRIVTGEVDARAAVREAIAAGARVIKMYPEATPQRTRLSVEEMRAIVSEAARHGVPVAAHATSDAAIREAVEAGASSIEHAYDVSDETLALMAQRKVWLVATDPSVEMAMAMTETWPVRPPEAEVREQLSGLRSRLRRAHDAGVPLAMGSDLYVPYGLGRGVGARSTLEGYLDAGLSPAEALRSATFSAGELVDPGAIGVLEPNAWADFIAMPGDPSVSLDALGSIALVMRRGVSASGLASTCSGSPVNGAPSGG
ncbi:amidohydrolase family protein [Brevundimonas sp. NPDC092305]|uniref:amidohydrolase family protein n=1 Tax=Brevundimonas sp. NPDC092305 TaxID=3363957 RepID=UPI0037F87491